jgi:hypothetical protein
MKNKILQTILASLGLAASLNATTIPEQTVTFVNVSGLGSDLVVNDETKGSVRVNTTILARSQRWTRDRVYILENNVIVPTGKTLTIEPGTIIRAARNTVDGTAASSPADPGALLIARGGTLIAKGTADAAIVFTSIDDPYVNGGIATIPEYENQGTARAKQLRTGGTKTTISSGIYSLIGGTLRVNGVGGITDGARPYTTSKSATASDSTINNIEGSWGGIVLCGYATVVTGYGSGVNASTGASTPGAAVDPVINATTGAITGTTFGVTQVEGMAGYPIYGYGGGDNDNDSSGCMSFVDNRYGGYVIASAKELNSYSFYGVGKNTVLEFLADYQNADDSYEFWGGAANLRRAVSVNPGDDGFDTDEGYLGACQYYVQIQGNSVTEADTSIGRAAANIGDNVSENDGPNASNDARPLTIYTLANATFIARGYNSKSFGSVSDGLDPAAGPCFKDNGSAQWYNCIVADSPHGAVMVTDKNNNTAADHGLTSEFVNGDQANDSNNRFGATRTSGGFDGASRADDLTTAQTGAPSTPDGLFNNCFFYRCGLAQHAKVWATDGATKTGKYADLAAFQLAVANDSSVFTASDVNLFPRSTDRTERNGISGNATKTRSNITAVQTAIKLSANYNQFNVSPFAATVPYSHRLSDLDIRPSTAAKTLANSALPARRGINTGANFAGAVRDSAWYSGWNFASAVVGDKANLFGNVAPEVPVVAVSVDSVTGKPKVTFGAVSTYKYVVERSTDNRLFTEVTTVTADEASESVVDPTTWTGTPVFYRVICL